MRQRLILLGGLGIFIFFLSSCASTKLTPGWHDAKYGKSLSTVMVVGDSDDQKRRRMFEDAFVREFQKNGIQAMASMDLIGPGKALDKEAIKAAALDRGMDAVLITHLIRAGMETVSGPPPTGPARLSDYGDLESYYNTIHGDRYQSDYSSRRMLVRLQNRLYDTQTEKLIWSAASETVEPKSVGQIIDSLCQVVMKDLRNKKLFP